eukprot:CAMPEP_0202892176 /NCGR_PEP_ID=MMETSP1392-20130828/1971_1 /ASSEMBLY_ACC=CAM_ASM_000868 /TAXON_ID=225041 /ORGANISM="Chlamydomonas chlamydogama, Strain SAG 11-48b" /LENGTH=191 /DNA_ID=CAMNT_0049576063 /DNA_START=109 /DNA_END=684 /DNA_ORIENTATION=-
MPRKQKQCIKLFEHGLVSVPRRKAQDPSAGCGSSRKDVLEDPADIGKGFSLDAIRDRKSSASSAASWSPSSLSDYGHASELHGFAPLTPSASTPHCESSLKPFDSLSSKSSREAMDLEDDTIIRRDSIADDGQCDNTIAHRRSTPLRLQLEGCDDFLSGGLPSCICVWPGMCYCAGDDLLSSGSHAEAEEA